MNLFFYPELYFVCLHNRTRVAGFSDCSMKSLAKVNDFCLYDRPKEVSWWDTAAQLHGSGFRVTGQELAVKMGIAMPEQMVLSDKHKEKKQFWDHSTDLRSKLKQQHKRREWKSFKRIV